MNLFNKESIFLFFFFFFWGGGGGWGGEGKSGDDLVHFLLQRILQRIQI